jgi:hypothetical protein
MDGGVEGGGGIGVRYWGTLSLNESTFPSFFTYLLYIGVRYSMDISTSFPSPLSTPEMSVKI